jgi:hypothetical protein
MLLYNGQQTCTDVNQFVLDQDRLSYKARKDMSRQSIGLDEVKLSKKGRVTTGEEKSMGWRI